MLDDFDVASYSRAVYNLRNYFRNFCEVELKIGLVTRDKILIDVRLINRGAESFGYLIRWVPEMHLRVWRDEKKIIPKQYIGANKGYIEVVIEPGENYTLKFAGVFSDGNLVFPKQCIFENVGSDFEVAYPFLDKTSDRIRIRIPD